MIIYTARSHAALEIDHLKISTNISGGEGSVTVYKVTIANQHLTGH